MGIDQEQDQRQRTAPQTPSQTGQRLAISPFSASRPVLRLIDADADAGKEIGGVEQDATCLNLKGIMPGLEPGSVAERQMRRQIGRDGDDQERDKGRRRPLAQGGKSTGRRAAKENLGAIDQIAAATISNASSTHRNHDCPEGHGPTVIVRHQ